MDVQHRRWLITGASSGFGRALAEAVLAAGDAVVATARRPAALADLAEHPAATVLALDVTDGGQVRDVVAEAVASCGVDVLVNCAGWTVDRLFTEKPREEWEREIAIDMWGFINATRAVLDHMIERGSGRIVSIGSDAGRIGEWREAVYSGTKAGVIAMSKAIAKEVGKHGITLNVVCPGFTPGDPEASGEHSIWQGEQGAQFDDEILKKVARSYPLRRLGTPEDIVGPVLLLASDRASYITGQTLSVSGGYTML